MAGARSRRSPARLALDTMIGLGRMLKAAAWDYIDDSCLSRGAAIAYYTVFSIAPVLVIVIAVAGFVFGEAAARGAIANELTGLMGHQSAEAIQAMIRSASGQRSGKLATILGIITLLLTATGVFSELQASLNAIWKAEPKGSTVTQIVRVRLLSLGLVMALGFLLIVSLVVSAALTALETWVGDIMPATAFFLHTLSFIVSFLMISAMFAAIYKVLPDRDIAWSDVAIGAVATAFLFTIGKSLIGFYIGSSQVASSYGAAGALVVVLVWIYYSAQIFLFGAEFTKAYAGIRGSQSPGAAQPGARAAAGPN